jgi:flagellar biogenesis protein FliO
MIGRKNKKQPLPIPLWLIGICGILAGGVIALDQPASAKNAKSLTKKESKAEVIDKTEAVKETVAVATAPPVITAAPAPESVGHNTEATTPTPPPVSREDQIVYSDSPKENQSAGLGMKNILALLLLASVAGGAMYYAKRKQKVDGPLKQSRTMSLVDTLRLGGRYSISLVHVPGRLLVIGSTDKGMNLLTEMSERDALSGQQTDTLQDRQEMGPKPSDDHGLVCNENDEFFNHLMNRISQAEEPPMSQPETVGNPGVSNLRNRLQQYQFGPSNA